MGKTRLQKMKDEADKVTLAKASEVAMNMSKFWYRQWYNDKVKPNLTREQKDKVMHRISDLTLYEPIWEDRETDYQDQFPELKPYISPQVGKISGLQLVAVMEAIFEEIIGPLPSP